MDNIYIEYIFEVTPKEPTTEILIAELGFAGFESFVEKFLRISSVFVIVTS